MNKKQITKESKIIIYGAASTGIILKTKLETNGYKVEGFIDQRANEIHDIAGTGVYNLDAIRFDDDTIVILAIKNVFEHEKIVKQLVKHGCKWVIFKPYSSVLGRNDDASNELSALWDLIVGKKQEINITAISKAEDLTSYSETIRKPIKKQGDYYIYSIPVELIFTDKKDEDNQWNDINILELYPHNELFRFFMGNTNSSYNSYIAFCEFCAKEAGVKISESWRESVIKNRANVFYEMQRNLGCNFEFFINSAPVAIWNEKGYFNLNSGKHRVCFLIACGFRDIPIKISESDYKKWEQHYSLDGTVAEIACSEIRLSSPEYLNVRFDDDMLMSIINEKVMVKIKQQFNKANCRVNFNWNNDYMLAELMFHKKYDIYFDGENKIKQLFEKMNYKHYENRTDEEYDCYFGYMFNSLIESKIHFIIQKVEVAKENIKGYNKEILLNFYKNGCIWCLCSYTKI